MGSRRTLLSKLPGGRIDKAVTTIVSDLARPDRAGRDPVSCIGCHAIGISDRCGSVREATRELAGAERDRIARLHAPTAAKLTALYAHEIATGFLTAIAAIAPAPKPGGRARRHPITLLVAHYEAEYAFGSRLAELASVERAVSLLPGSPPVAADPRRAHHRPARASRHLEAAFPASSHRARDASGTAAGDCVPRRGFGPAAGVDRSLSPRVGPRRGLRLPAQQPRGPPAFVALSLALPRPY